MPSRLLPSMIQISEQDWQGAKIALRTEVGETRISGTETDTETLQFGFSRPRLRLVDETETNTETFRYSLVRQTETETSAVQWCMFKFCSILKRWFPKAEPLHAISHRSRGQSRDVKKNYS